MESLFGWQLAGDMFKMCSWLLSYLMVAKAMTSKFVITEIVFNLSYLALAFLFMKLNGIVGLTQGYLINYIIYTIVMIIIFRNVIIVKK
jgi:PST family polysaccharide transporter